MVKKAEQQKQEFYKQEKPILIYVLDERQIAQIDYGVIKSAVDPDGTSDFALSTSEKSKQPISEIDPE